ncbi:hypothetical protein H2256_02145 [Campylobacter sp. RM9929]|uniref:hypothetical protein n=1 Tax=Campylobacter molothri TaxID=1032242 RepID=UPI001E00FF9C|nr:hypothetical protein [Campylobacter sp. RM10537]MBZ7947759.1 hypothetical protein [Campylobacter sp. RM9929]MBZ7949488.1 hypothetical protein [Campylobacter sp. RM10534]MBZ7967016.1 hypothetical protein [Campylobacter sp. RM9756]ULN99425.1 hypothetical protein CMOL_0231 [Campylobacter sp. RM10537]
MKDKSLEELNIVRILILALSFISICTALILFLLLPVLKDYEQINLRENSQIGTVNSFKIDLKSSEDKVTHLQNINKKNLDQFQQKFDEKKFNQFLKYYFKNIKITNIKLQSQEEYLYKKLKIEGLMDNPKNFYNFIDALKDYDNLIKISYPIVLKATPKGIAINFYIEIYSD